MHTGQELKRVRLELFQKWPEFVVLPKKAATCDTCADNETCEHAFDAYNTDGDCLASK